MHRKAALWNAVFAILALVFTSASSAQTSYPERPIRLLVGFSPGGPTDVMARRVVSRLEPMLGQSIVVENKPGASTTIAMAHLARATPDGYTLYFGGSGAYATTPLTKPDLSYDVNKDFTPIALAGAEQLAFAVNPSVPAQTLDELVAAIKANPGTYSIGHSGAGNITHLTAELLKHEAGGIDLVAVAYKGAAPAVVDILAGHIQVTIAGLGSLYQHHKAGKVRILAIADTERTVLAPEIPTAAEAGFPGVVATSTFALIGPAGVPEAAVAKLSDAVNRVMADEAFQKEILTASVAPTPPSTPESTAAFLSEELAKWRDLVKNAGLEFEQ